MEVHTRANPVFPPVSPSFSFSLSRFASTTSDESEGILVVEIATEEDTMMNRKDVRQVTQVAKMLERSSST